jgi:hypothetical protein
MTDEKSASVKGGVQPPQPKTRLITFSILMAGILLSLFALYKISRPFVENHNYLDIALIAGIVFTILAYAMAVKGGVLPSPPKVKPDGNKLTPTSQKFKASAAIKGGIDPPQRKP